MTTVVNCNQTNNYDVYIGRPSKWGNPFIIGRDGNRKQVLDKFRSWIKNKEYLLNAIESELKDKVLGCHCYPKACHGNILADIADKKIVLI